jgi:hypothetical protein
MVKGKRNGKAALLLSAALAATGCSTGWHAVREDWTPISTTTNFQTSNQRKTETNRQFEINTLSVLNGNYLADVTQKLSQETFDEVKYGNLVKYNKMLQEENKTIIPVATFGLRALGAGLSFGFGDFDDPSEMKIKRMVLLGLSGAALGALIDSGIKVSIGKSSRAKETGETKTVLENQQTIKKVIKSSASENPAAGIKVIVEGVNYTTDLKGKVNLSDILESRYPNYFCRESNFSGSGMENRIRSIPLVTGLKPKTLDMLMKKLAEEADPVKITVKLRTNESPLPGENVTNWNGTASLNGYNLSDDDIYKVIGGFIDSEVNSRIVPIRFDLKDLVSRTSIPGATFSYETNAPSREELINQYFNEKLKSLQTRE